MGFFLGKSQCLWNKIKYHSCFKRINQDISTVVDKIYNLSISNQHQSPFLLYTEQCAQTWAYDLRKSSHMRNDFSKSALTQKNSTLSITFAARLLSTESVKYIECSDVAWNLWLEIALLISLSRITRLLLNRNLTLLLVAWHRSSSAVFNLSSDMQQQFSCWTLTPD